METNNYLLKYAILYKLEIKFAPKTDFIFLKCIFSFDFSITYVKNRRDKVLSVNLFSKKKSSTIPFLEKLEVS